MSIESLSDAFASLALRGPAAARDRAAPFSDRRSRESTTTTATTPTRDPDKVELSPEASSAGRPRGADGEPLSEGETREVEELKARDQEVRTHEQAHVAAAGPLFRGGPYYDYTRGPDGNQYATGGRVEIDTSEGSTPEETIERANRVIAAALAPAEPSSQDRAVAAQATRQLAEARAEQAEQRAAEAQSNDDNPDEQDEDTTEPSDGSRSVTDDASFRTQQAVASYAAANGSLQAPRLDLAA